MCGPTVGTREAPGQPTKMVDASSTAVTTDIDVSAPVERLLEPPTMMARYACAGLMVAIFAIWGKFSFLDEHGPRYFGEDVHSGVYTLVLTVSYLLALPLLRKFSSDYLSKSVDVKLLLKETMVVYNAGQVLLNGWMVYRIMDALLFRGHPFWGDIHTVASGTTYAAWIHYCDKYLEFFDTFFMVLRGRMDQVSFLHVYHHVSIAWAWWIAMYMWPGGDVYFGALLNSWIHVMMYSYYTLSLLKINCPWKKYLTQAQLLQFTCVNIYTLCTVKTAIDYGKDPKLYFAIGVQLFEMTSLFFLFMRFYAKAYDKKKPGLAKAKQSSAESDSGTDVTAEQVSVSSESSEEGAKKDQ